MIRLKSIFLSLCILCSALTVAAQTSAATGAIQGEVADPSGAAVPNATATLTNTDTGVLVTTVRSDTKGEFVFPLLVPGTYSIEVKATGFAAIRLEGITVEVTKVTNTKANLTVGTVTAEVAVTATNQVMVDTTTATTGDVQDSKQIQETPLPTRNFLNLTTQQAGVAATMQSPATVGAGTPTIEVAGQRSVSNSFVLDGVDANDFHNNTFGTSPIPNPDAMEEFRVNTSMYDASQGHASGGNINGVIRSGTNRFHGGLFEFNRNTDYNANDFFFNAQHAPRPVLQQNQFGGTIGGPVPKVRDTFWFFSYQGTRQVNGVSSAVSGPQPVLPARTSSTTAGDYTVALASAFNIPQAAIDPVAVNLLLAPGQYGGYLFANGSCSGCAPGAIGTIAIALPTTYNANQYVASGDHQFGANNHLSVKSFTNLSSEFQPTGGTTLGQGSSLPANNYHLAVSDFQSFRPNLINEIDAGYTWIRNGTYPVSNVTVGQIGEYKWDASFGDSIPNLVFSTGSNAQSFGGANTNGSVHGGSASISLNDTVSWTHGSHTLRFGEQLTRYRWNYENDYGATGEIGFANFASFLEGSPNLLFVSTGQHYNKFRDLNVSEFIQDDYHATRRLTLNLGLRIDELGWPHDVLDRIGNYDLSLVPAGCVAGGGGACMEKGFIAPSGTTGVGTPGVSDTTLTSSNPPLLAPRISFAYDVFGTGKLAVRGGYAIFNISDSGIPLLQLNAGPPVLDLYNVSVTGESDVLANPWPAGLLLPSQYPAIPPMGQFEGTFNSNGTPQFLGPNGESIPLVGNYSMDRNLVHSYSQQWNLTTEYSPARDWIIQLGYIGSHAIHLLDEDKSNQAVLASPEHPITYTYTSAGGGTVTTTITTNSAANASLRVPQIGISAGGNTAIENRGYSYYDGFIAELRHAFAHGVRANLDYTWSKSIDDVSSIGGFVVNPALPDLSRALSDFNEPQRLVFTYAWDLPGPKSGWQKTALGGWQWTGVYTLQSGMPFTVTSSSGGSLEGLSGQGTANVAPCNGPVVNSGSAYDNRKSYLNESCFAAVPVLASGTVVSGYNQLQGPGPDSFPVGPTGPGDPGTGSLLGNAPRNGWQGPTDSDFDMAVMKNFPLHVLGDGGNLAVRFEGFKVFNNVNFSNPLANINSSTFGTLSSTLDTTGRILQLAAKLNF